MKTIFILIACFIALPFHALADEKARANQAEAMWQKRLNTLEKGKSFVYKNGQFIIMPTLTAEIQSNKMAKTTLKSADRFDLGKFKIVEKTSIFKNEGVQAKIGVPGNEHGIVVLNSQTGNFALATGNVIVKYKSGTNPAYLARIVDAADFKDFPQLNRVIITLAPGKDLLIATKKLSKLQRVIVAEPDVIEYFQTEQ